MKTLAFVLDRLIVFGLLILGLKLAWDGSWLECCAAFGAQALYSMEIRLGRALERLVAQMAPPKVKR